MPYVDGCVAAVPTANKEAYRKQSEKMASLFKEHGAIAMVECWGDEVPDGELTSFPKAVKCKDDETVCFSWMLWPSKEARNEAMPKLMADPQMCEGSPNSLFDGKRQIHGGFEVFVST